MPEASILYFHLEMDGKAKTFYILEKTGPWFTDKSEIWGEKTLDLIPSYYIIKVCSFEKQIFSETSEAIVILATTICFQALASDSKRHIT